MRVGRPSPPSFGAWKLKKFPQHEGCSDRDQAYLIGLYDAEYDQARMTSDSWFRFDEYHQGIEDGKATKEDKTKP